MCDFGWWDVGCLPDLPQLAKDPPSRGCEPRRRRAQRAAGALSAHAHHTEGEQEASAHRLEQSRLLIERCNSWEPTLHGQVGTLQLLLLTQTRHFNCVLAFFKDLHTTLVKHSINRHSLSTEGEPPGHETAPLSLVWRGRNDTPGRTRDWSRDMGDKEARLPVCRVWPDAEGRVHIAVETRV